MGRHVREEAGDILTNLNSDGNFVTNPIGTPLAGHAFTKSGNGFGD